MSITLYTSPTSIGVVSHIALEESALPFSIVSVDFASKQQTSAEYLEINPKARVPSLIVDKGIITETPAILTYLAQMAPDSSIGLPDDPFEHAQIQSFNAYLCSTAHVAHAHKMRGSRWVDDQAALSALTQNVPKTMALCFDMIEQQMFKGPWVHGTGFTISDPYLYRISSWAEIDGVEINNYPKIRAHREAMAQRDSVRAVEAYFQSDS
ncbi:glutathione S-transferase family protein [Granulosicoccus sp.]|nr:glutathione S-transferase family protein [Granulosicoccus sp.]MDB4224029.1 glutathione S-transferase family protein [Granulosicoccus sp.]